MSISVFILPTRCNIVIEMLKNKQMISIFKVNGYIKPISAVWDALSAPS